MKQVRIVFLAALLIFLATPAVLARYNPNARLALKNMNFCEAKPKGFGRYEPVAGKDSFFKRGDDVYLYLEAQNCKAQRGGKDFSISLILDMDIYYEDGQKIYSQKDVKNFDHASPREFSETMLWVMIETDYLKPGEYKVEVTVRDEFSGKSAFALKKFHINP